MKMKVKVWITLIIAVLTAGALMWANETRQQSASADAGQAAAWRAPIVVTAEPNYLYDEKVIVQFHPSGLLYIAVNDFEMTTKKRLIRLYKSDGRTSTFVRDISDGNLMAYEQDMAIGNDGWIHIVWAEGAGINADNQYIKYRFFDGVSWSAIITLKSMVIGGTVGGHNKEKVDDVRMAVDDDHNVFVANMIWPDARCQSLSRYGSKVYIDPFPMGGRSKHGCVAADSKYVHLAWVQLVGGEYTIQYARRDNRPGTGWNKIIQIAVGVVDRSYIRVNNQDVPQLIYLKTPPTQKTRDIHHRSWQGNGFSGSYMVSDTRPLLYHPPDIAAVDNNNFIIFAQTWASAASNYYNWYRNGKWGGWTQLNAIPFLRPHGSVALNNSGIAAIAYCVGGAVLVTTSDELVINSLPVAVMQADKETIFWDETVNFTSNGSYDSDGAIARYEWRFAGDSQVYQGPSVAYTFNKSYGAVKARLTVIDNKNGRGIAEKTITVNSLFTPVSTVTRQLVKTLLYNRNGYVIQWVPNAKNEQAGYNVAKYKIYRKTADTEFAEIGEVAADKRVFADVAVETDKEYVYAVVAVDDQGRKSPYDNY